MPNFAASIPQLWPKGQYFFDETTLKDLEWILALKKLDFSLREIHSILSLKRISNFADAEDLEELKELFKSKRDFCQQEIQKKEAVIKNLDAHILRMAQCSAMVISPNVNHNSLANRIERKEADGFTGRINPFVPG